MEVYATPILSIADWTEPCKIAYGLSYSLPEDVHT